MRIFVISLLFQVAVSDPAKPKPSPLWVEAIEGTSCATACDSVGATCTDGYWVTPTGSASEFQKIFEAGIYDLNTCTNPKEFKTCSTSTSCSTFLDNTDQYNEYDPAAHVSKGKCYSPNVVSGIPTKCDVVDIAGWRRFCQCVPVPPKGKPGPMRFR